MGTFIGLYKIFSSLLFDKPYIRPHPSSEFALNKQRILVTGGCGYIGSHTIVDLIESGYDVISVDNGINSSFDTLRDIEAVTNVKVINITVTLKAHTFTDFH